MVTTKKRTAIGFPLLPVPDASGSLSWPSLEQSILDHMRVLLLIRPSELRRHPSLGAGLERFLHQGDGLRTRRRIHDAVQTTLQRYESRIRLDGIRVEPGQPGELIVSIAFRYRHNERSDDLTLSIELEG